MSFSIKQYNPKVSLPKSDLCLEEVSELYKLVDNLSPKIDGNWEILIINPTIKDCKKLLDDKSMPVWLNITIFLQQKKMDQVCLEFPEYQPRKVSFIEQAREILSKVNHIVDKKAFNTLVDAYRGNIADFEKTLLQLDKECTGSKITFKEVQSKVNYVKPVYASDVMNAFLLKRVNRWKLLNKLIQELGESYAYNALYKYTKTLLQQKQLYLSNKDVELRVVTRIDAPSICFAYTLFSLSKGYRQLYGIFYNLDNRGKDCLERIADANL